jgi:chromosome segregation ATPase
MNDSSRAAGDPFLQLNQMEAELGDLLSELDREQDSVDEHLRSITAKEKQVDELRREVRKKEKRRSARLLEVSCPPGAWTIPDDSEFKDDHYDLIQSKRNAIVVLVHAIANMKEEIDPLEAEVWQLRQIQTALTCESASLKKRLNRSDSERRKSDQNFQLTRDQLHDLKLDLIGRRRLMKDAEVFRACILQRFSSISEVSDEKTGLPAVVRNLQTEIYQFESEIERINKQIHEVESEKDNQQKERQEAMQDFDKILNWKLEKNHLKAELDNFTGQLATAESEFSRTSDFVTSLESRYQKLASIAAKWNVPETLDDIDTDIDELLQVYAHKSVKRGRTFANQTGERDQLGIENANLEGILSKRREELQRSIGQFTIDQARLKETIHNTRASCAEREQKIVEQIGVLKRKIADHKFK